MKEPLASLFIRRLGLLRDRQRLVKVKSWLPYLEGGYIWWPTMLIQEPGQRATVTPRWCSIRFRSALRSIAGTSHE